MLSNILGFYGQKNKWTHDHSAALSINGSINQYVQLERITGKKFDNSIPNYLPKIIDAWGYDISELNFASVNTFALNEDFLKKSDDNIISEDNRVYIHTNGSSYLVHKYTSGKINGYNKEVLIVPHELAHIFSNIPFFGMFKNKSLLIHVDGMASISNASAWLYENGKIKLLEYTSELRAALLNFSYNDLSCKVLELNKNKYLSMPGKLMGLSSFGTENKELLNWLIKNNFAFSFKHISTNDIIKAANNLGYNIDKIELKSKFSYDYAACVQKYFEDQIISFIEKHRINTGAEYLYYSGGAALNIKLNSKLVKLKKFKEIYIPPPSGDSGLSLGASSYYNWINNISTRKISVFSNNYGLKKWDYDPNFSIDEISDLIYNGKVIGIATGNGEIGPRALGHRSIIALPIKPMFKKVSMDIKKREWYRPLAPIILESHMHEIFDDVLKTPFMYYMLQEFKIKDKYKRIYPAITHVDGTARAQIVPDNNSELQLIYDILSTIYDRYGIHCLINTSFNVAGKPIVHTENDAIKSGREMGLDAVIVNNDLIKLR